jgi:ribosome-binding factor A
MKATRTTRINELLKREVASLLYREMAGEGLDLARVTVTRAVISRDLRHARVSVSVRGTEEEARRAFRLLERHRPAIQHGIARDIALKYTPVLTFERDESIEEGDRVLHLIETLPPAGGAGTSEGPADDHELPPPE